MAFPTVAGFGGGNSGGNVTTTTVDLTVAGTASVGDLLIVLFAKDGNAAPTWPSPWDAHKQDVAIANSAGYRSSAWRIVESGDATSFDLSHPSEASAWQVYRITGQHWKVNAYGTGPIATVVANAAGTTGTSNAPNSDSASPAYPQSDTLWIAACAYDDGTVAATAAPTNYTDLRNDRWNDAAGIGIASARRELNAASENPGSFTLSASKDWGAWGLYVRPDIGFPVAWLYGSNSGGNVTQSDVNVAALVGTPNEGDLVIVSIAKDGTGTFTWPASPAFTSLLAGTAFTSALHEVRYRIWQSGDSTTVSITHATESTAWEVIRIAAGTFDAGTAPYATGTTGDSTDPNPPNGNPGGWDVEKTLWIAEAANDGNVAITGGPSDYSFFRNDRVAASTGSGIAVAVKESEAASEDPGVFTMTTEQWGAATIAVRPSSANPPQNTTGVAVSAAWATVLATALAISSAAGVPAAASWSLPAASAQAGEVAASGVAVGVPWAEPTAGAQASAEATGVAAAATWAAVTAAAGAGAEGVAASAVWTAPDASAQAGEVGAAGVSIAVAWNTPTGSAQAGDVGTSGVPVSATWAAPTAGAEPGSVPASGLPASVPWSAPTAAAEPGDVGASILAASVLWVESDAAAQPGPVDSAGIAIAIPWIVPTAAAGATSEASSVAVELPWGVPSAAASLGGQNTDAIPVSIAWSTPTAAAQTSADASAIPVSLLWSVPAAGAQPGEVGTSALPTTVAWGIPNAAATAGETAQGVAVSLPWVIPNEGAAPGDAPSQGVAVGAVWTAPNAGAEAGPTQASGVAVSSAWVGATAGAVPGAVSADGVAVLVAWAVPVASAEVVSTATGVAVSVAWVVPTAGAAPGAIDTAGVSAAAAWIAPIAGAEGGAQGTLRRDASNTLAVLSPDRQATDVEPERELHNVDAGLSTITTIDPDRTVGVTMAGREMTEV